MTIGSSIAATWPLYLDPDTPAGRRYLVDQFNARNSIGKLSLKDGREGVTVVDLAAIQHARFMARCAALGARIDRAMAERGLPASPGDDAA